MAPATVAANTSCSTAWAHQVLASQADVSSADGYDPEVFTTIIVLVVVLPVALCVLMILVELIMPP